MSECRHGSKPVDLKTQVTNLEQAMQRLNEERERIERAYDQLQDENAQLKQANELKQVALPYLRKDSPAPCQSVVSTHATPALNRERVHATAQFLRAAEHSRYSIGKRSLDFLHQSYQTQLADIKTKQEAMASAEAKLESNAANLALKHDKEAAEFEAANLKLSQEFDAKRETWAMGSKVEVEQLLVEEGATHASLVESLTAKRLREEEEAHDALHETIKRLERSGQSSCRWNDRAQCYQQIIDPRIIQAQEIATTCRNERQRAHDKVLAGHEDIWTARRLELQNRISLGKPQLQNRLRLAEEYHARLGELVQCWKSVQQRQTKELQTLADERDAVHASITAYKTTEAELLEERRTVDEWWIYLVNEAAACRQQIDEDEQNALKEIVRLRATVAADAESSAWPCKVEDALPTTGEDLDVNAAEKHGGTVIMILIDNSQKQNIDADISFTDPEDAHSTCSESEEQQREEYFEKYPEWEEQQEDEEHSNYDEWEDRQERLRIGARERKSGREIASTITAWMNVGMNEARRMGLIK